MESKRFLYTLVYNDLLGKINSGELRPGDLLPTENELAATHQVSKITTKRAMDMLKRDGLIRRVQGKGTFVSEPPAPSEEGALPSMGKKMIGVVMEHASSSFGLDLMFHIIRRLNEVGYKTCFRFSFGSVERENEEVDDLVRRGIDGLMIMPCHNSLYSSNILRLILDGFPVVLLDKQMRGIPVTCISSDGENAIIQLVRHLHDRNAKTLALCSVAPSTATSVATRVEGYRRGVAETGVTSVGECIVQREFNVESLHTPQPKDMEFVRNWLANLSTRPDGVVCTEFYMARVLAAAAKSLELEIGKDLKVVCIDEDPDAAYGPFFTHMRQDEVAIGDVAVDVLQTLLNGATSVQREISIPAVFHMGSST